MYGSFIYFNFIYTFHQTRPLWTFSRTFNDSSSFLLILLQHSSIGGVGWGWWGEVVVLRASLVTSMLLRQCWSWANSMGKIKHNIEHSVFTFFYFETWTHNQQPITGVGEVQWGVGVGVGGGGGGENGNRKNASKNLWIHPKRNKAVQNFLAVTCHIYAVQTDVNTFFSSFFLSAK